MWVLLSILAALCWAISATIDKFIFAKWIKQSFIPMILLGFFGLIISVIITVYHGLSSLSYFNIFLAIVAGIVYILSNGFFLKALQVEEVSRIVPLAYLSSLIVLFYAVIFLGEVLTIYKYIGIFLLVLGAILISIKDFSKIRFSKAFK